MAKFTDYFDDLRRKLDGAVQAYNQAAGSFESRVLVSARRLRELDVTTSPEIPTAEPIDTVPRVLTSIGLMGVPEEAVTQPDLRAEVSQVKSMVHVRQRPAARVRAAN